MCVGQRCEGATAIHVFFPWDELIEFEFPIFKFVFVFTYDIWWQKIQNKHLALILQDCGHDFYCCWHHLEFLLPWKLGTTTWTTSWSLVQKDESVFHPTWSILTREPHLGTVAETSHNCFSCLFFVCIGQHSWQPTTTDLSIAKPFTNGYDAAVIV